MRTRTWRILMFGLVAVVCSFTLTLLAVTELGVFELEGNAEDTLPAGMPEDWQTVNSTSYVADGLGGHAFEVTGVIPDMHAGVPADPSAFFNKQTKDTVDIPGNWTSKGTSVPDKDDLNNAYAAAYVDPESGDTVIAFGADRYSAGNGTAYLGFWFFQDPNVAPAKDGGPFSGHHIPGDVLVLVNFAGGGDNPIVDVLEWVDGVDVVGDVSTNLKRKFQDESLCGGSTEATLACAVTNSLSPVRVYWPFEYKNSPSCDGRLEGSTCYAPTLAFFEGALNLSELFRNRTPPCISRFLAETRSSDSPTADLKDFAWGQFELCGIGISKSCTKLGVPNGDEINYETTITVRNTGMGPLYDALVADSYPTSETTPNATKYYAVDCDTSELSGLDCEEVAGLGTIPANGTVSIAATFKSTLGTVTDTATVAARSSSTATERTVVPETGDKPAQATCNTLIDAEIVVNKTCPGGAYLELKGDQLVVAVTFEGSVTNISEDTDVWIDSITDSPSGWSASLPEPVKLGRGKSLAFGPWTYYPTTMTSAACNTGLPNQGSTCFTDVVTAKGRMVLGGGEVKDTGQADCPLCK